MEMFQVRYVLAVARELNFTRAARSCNVSQPALTKAVKGLEQELGAPLFHREGKQVLVSDFGRSLLPHLQQIIAGAEATHLLADNFRLLNSVPVRLGVMVTVGPVRLSRFLARFQTEYPGVEVAVTEAPLGTLRDLLQRAEIDLAILNAPEDLRAEFTVHELYRERYVVIFPPEHRLAALGAVRLADLADEPYVDRLSCEMREMVMEVCRQKEINLYARFRSEREDWVQSMVLARIGFAFMPECSVTIPELLRRPLVEPEVVRTISLVSAPGRPYSPATGALVAAARQFDWPG
ncbi:MAG TPA: LysR family transcriptional regulator [Devosiaceae bacterium]|jgi:DNA-binding transcriptional LysR family regulator|nr:LysR family transcriptional regulator [Devosiaceae bacterium]